MLLLRALESPTERKREGERKGKGRDTKGDTDVFVFFSGKPAKLAYASLRCECNKLTFFIPTRRMPMKSALQITRRR